MRNKCNYVEVEKCVKIDSEKPLQEGQEESLDRPCTRNSENCVILKNSFFLVKKTIYTCNQITMGSESAN